LSSSRLPDTVTALPYVDMQMECTYNGHLADLRARLALRCNSLPTPTMSYWSKSCVHPFPNNRRGRLLTASCFFPQRVLVERAPECRELHSWTADRERLLWQGVPCDPQAYKWLQGTTGLGKQGRQLADAYIADRSCSSRQAKTTPTSHARFITTASSSTPTLLGSTRLL